MSNRLFDFFVRILCVAVAAMVVGATTVALVVAAATETLPAAGTVIYDSNLLLDAVSAPNYAAVIVLGTVIFVIASMRTRAKAKIGAKR